MIISEVNIEFIKPKDGLIGFASLVVGKQLYLSSIGIHKKLDGSGYRLTYPSKGSFSVFHPITREMGQAIEEEILKKLNDVMKKVNLSCSNTSSPI